MKTIETITKKYFPTEDILNIEHREFVYVVTLKNHMVILNKDMTLKQIIFTGSIM